MAIQAENSVGRFADRLRLALTQAGTKDTCTRIGVVSLVLMLAIFCVPGCGSVYSNMLAHPEFSRCHSMDYDNRQQIGLAGYVSLGMSESHFLDAFHAHRFPGTKLVGPVNAEGDVFAGIPKNLNFSRAYLIEDRSGCPLWRYFFDENPRLQMADTMYRELGGYFFDTGYLSRTPGVIGQ